MRVKQSVMPLELRKVSETIMPFFFLVVFNLKNIYYEKYSDNYHTGSLNYGSCLFCGKLFNRNTWDIYE